MKTFYRILGLSGFLVFHSFCSGEVPSKESLYEDSLRISLYSQNLNIENANLLRSVSFSIMDSSNKVAIGTGFWIDSNGWAISVLSSVSGMIKVGRIYSIRRSVDGKTLSASVLHYHSETEIVILKAELDSEFQPENFKTLEPVEGVIPKQGSILHCMGSQGEFFDSFHQSIVSKESQANISRKNPFQPYIGIHPSIGNSKTGGFCIDLKGRLAGILAHPLYKSSQELPVSFLLPTNTLRDVLTEWEEYRNQYKEILKGIIPIPLLTKSLQEKLNLDNNRGVLVSMVEIPSSAHNVGIKRYDLIQSINSIPVQNVDELYLEMKKHYQSKSSISIGIIREGKRITVKFQ